VSDWSRELAAERAEFVEALIHQGFSQEEDGRLVGTVAVPTPEGERPHAVEVILPLAFPFSQPKARPIDGSGSRSWHHNRDGALCLYSTDEGEDLPWRTPEALVERIVEWFTNDEQGWPDDGPDLDLERYFERVDGLLVVDDVEALIGRPIRIKRYGAAVLKVVGKGTKPRRARSRDLYGWVADIGEPDRPPRDWDELNELILAGASPDVAKCVERSGGCVLLLRHARKGHPGVLGLMVTETSRGLEVKALETAEGTEDVKRLRAGSNQDQLRAASVAIAGVGAIGSFTADLLARRGIGQLLLKDGERLRPGNCVRHLAGLDMIGLNKAEAVRDVVSRSGGLCEVQVDTRRLVRPDEARDLLLSHDLVVDATAHGSTSALLVSAATFTDRPLLSVCLVVGGRVARVDRWPLQEGETHDANPSREVPTPVMLREGGCGDPVSPATPIAVVLAAGLVAEASVGVLTGTGAVPTRMVDVERSAP
jgi:hypothetical protein